MASGYSRFDAESVKIKLQLEIERHRKVHGIRAMRRSITRLHVHVTFDHMNQTQASTTLSARPLLLHQ
jgi:hypothetical protein